MEGLVKVLQDLAAKVPVLALVLGVLGSLVIVGQMIVLLTPSKADDAWLAKLKEMPVVGMLLKALEAFAPIQKK